MNTLEIVVPVGYAVCELCGGSGEVFCEQCVDCKGFGVVRTVNMAEGQEVEL